MTVTARVAVTIQHLPLGEVFGYQDIPEYQRAPTAVVKALSRMVNSNQIKRIERGRFYRPKQGLLGEIKPSDNALLKSLLYKDGCMRGYVTGTSLFNQLGLSTQVPIVVTIAVAGAPQQKDFGRLQVKLVKARAPVTAETVTLLQYLDVLREIKKIPDTDINQSLTRMEKRLAQLDEASIKRIKPLALQYYPAQVQALLGLLLQRQTGVVDKKLKQALNPLTRFKMGLDPVSWPEQKTWNIK